MKRHGGDGMTCRKGRESGETQRTVTLAEHREEIAAKRRQYIVLEVPGNKQLVQCALFCVRRPDLEWEFTKYYLVLPRTVSTKEANPYSHIYGTWGML